MKFHLQVLIVSIFFQRLIRLCGEVKAAPSENEEIQFLCVVCAKLRQDPYLVNFFLEVRQMLVLKSCFFFEVRQNNVGVEIMLFRFLSIDCFT